jgi:primary-amine oxidase
MSSDRWSPLRLVPIVLLSCMTLALRVPVRAEERVARPLQAAHPMDALTADEITASANILRAAGKLGGTALLVSLTLDENPKAEVRAWTPGKPFGRRAFAVLLDGGRLAEAHIDLDARTLTAWAPVENRQAAVTIDEFIAAGKIAKRDERWRAAMAKRGITEFDNVVCFALTVGPSVDPALAGRRLLNVSCVDRSGAGNNLWGKPIDSLMATVDIAAGKVLGVTDLGVVPPPPETPSHAWADSGRARAISRPVEIAAPQGTNISVAGGAVRWDNWSFHVRLDPRLGAVLSLIRYDDHGTPRDIAYQISASEMFVPYMDPAATWSFRGYMDIGEYGFGLLATQLRPGQDCPDSATFLDLTIADTKGDPIALKGVVCLFERPSGDPLWRHDEAVNGTFEMRANTELVVRMAPVVGNYDYLVDYVFDRAGDIDVKLGAYGIDETKGVASSTLADPTAAADTAYGTLIAKRLLAVNHDHYMAFRLDMDVDGTDNRLVENRIMPRRISADGARRSLWQIESHPMAVEGPVTTPLGAAQFRIESAAKRNAQGYPTGYELLPGHTDTSILAPDDPIQVRAGFTAYTLWSSAYAPDERFAAGAYPNENPEADGLPKWVTAKRSIDGRDLVLWYTIGFRHVPRAEDWPAMPGLWHGFRLRPFNFFDRNPALDVPPVDAAAR